MIIKNKVLAYIINNKKLLVFNQPDYPEAGIQVVGGTVEDNEDIKSAIIREIEEETGLKNFTVISYLGKTERNMEDYGKDETHIRHFFHVTTEENRNKSWTHIEKFSSGSKNNILFNFYWIDFKDANNLILSHGELLDLIKLN
ncbi:MAG: NUDIX domain-containing protein [Candidatus Sericytochromatia bacterium]